MPIFNGLNEHPWGTSWNTAKLNNSWNLPNFANQRPVQRKKFYNKPRNFKNDIPAEVIDDSLPSMSLDISVDNIVAFHGFDSIFATQNNFPVMIGEFIYMSCDHYYQLKKVEDLTQKPCEKLKEYVRNNNGKWLMDISQRDFKKSFSSIAREELKKHKISKEVIEEWRATKGVMAIQEALLAKTSQSAHLRAALKESMDKIIVHTYKGDSVFASGCSVHYFRKWIENQSKKGIKTIKIPSTFPLTEETVKYCPEVANGRNILGVILMQLRNKINNDDIEIVDMGSVFSLLRL